MSTYKYSTLFPNYIRALVIHPGSKNSPISCTIRNITIQSKERHKAISYVWGTPNFTQHITLESQDHFITPSLRRALEVIRSQTEEQIVWADQLCINQSDTQERSSQVGIMSLIYANAEMVYVILEGMEEGSGQAAADLVKRMKVEIEQELKKFGSLSEIPPLEQGQLKIYDTLDWPALNTMLLTSWFSRAWVVQEVGLARKAIIGYAGSEIDACTFGATNPRDHSVSKVYINFAKQWLHKTQQAHLFACVDHESLPRDLAAMKSQQELPSWCPRWDSLKNGGFCLNTVPEYTWYRAVKHSNLQFSEHSEDLESIKVGGFVFDAISRGFEYIEESGSIEKPSPQLRMFHVYLNLLTHIDRSRFVHVYDDPLEALASTCNAGFIHDNHGIDCLAYMNTLPEKHILPADLPQSSGDPKEFDELSAETTIARRRVFITTKGYIGIGPKALLKGDVCCILFGASVPYILRPLEDDSYLLVGECYVQDIMLREAVDMYRDEQEFEECEFLLR
ncbi:hypothetical protein HYALB_00004267 [Hymenoscyphus albidus]|uniref:Heterokaryon incompatibility domain-containing protein n=1 Tax=Hymenoscyphus albidus TaxID=595503 RepID=A0A9N9LMC8_9HELO|nr:hypothetical protein HYALB_00004267 [Hymenoscyphus albidus]